MAYKEKSLGHASRVPPISQAPQKVLISVIGSGCSTAAEPWEQSSRGLGIESHWVPGLFSSSFLSHHIINRQSVLNQVLQGGAYLLIMFCLEQNKAWYMHKMGKNISDVFGSNTFCTIWPSRWHPRFTKFSRNKSSLKIPVLSWHLTTAGSQSSFATSSPTVTLTRPSWARGRRSRRRYRRRRRRMAPPPLSRLVYGHESRATVPSPSAWSCKSVCFDDLNRTVKDSDSADY